MEDAGYFDALKGLAVRMESLKLNPRARLDYHGLADSVFWSDELPSQLSRVEDDALRLVLRCRTMRILAQEPNVEYQPYWNAAKDSFPGWIGFLEQRVKPDPKVVKFYEVHAKEFSDDIDRLIAEGDL